MTADQRFSDPQPRIHPTAELKSCRLGRYSAIGERVVLREVSVGDYTYFDRGVLDRLQKGNWFEDPSDTAISCRQTGPITIHDIDLGEGGEEVFKQGISLIWKKQVVNRIYDKQNDTLIYLAHSRELTEGSAKMSISTVPLYGEQVTWKNGKPE